MRISKAYIGTLIIIVINHMTIDRIITCAEFDICISRHYIAVGSCRFDGRTAIKSTAGVVRQK